MIEFEGVLLRLLYLLGELYTHGEPSDEKDVTDGLMTIPGPNARLAYRTDHVDAGSRR